MAQKAVVEINRYEGGINATITVGQKSVSVSKSDFGFWSTKTDRDDRASLHRNGEAALKRAKEYLERE